MPQVWNSAPDKGEGMNQYFTRSQKMTIVQGIFSIVFIIDVLQLWLLIATMSSYLGGDSGVPFPAALFSLLCLALNVGLLKFLYSLDRSPLSVTREK